MGGVKLSQDSKIDFISRVNNGMNWFLHFSDFWVAVVKKYAPKIGEMGQK